MKDWKRPMNTLFPERYFYMVLQEEHCVLFMGMWQWSLFKGEPCRIPKVNVHLLYRESSLTPYFPSVFFRHLILTLFHSHTLIQDQVMHNSELWLQCCHVMSVMLASSEHFHSGSCSFHRSRRISNRDPSGRVAKMKQMEQRERPTHPALNCELPLSLHAAQENLNRRQGGGKANWMEKNSTD